MNDPVRFSRAAWVFFLIASSSPGVASDERELERVLTQQIQKVYDSVHPGTITLQIEERIDPEFDLVFRQGAGQSSGRKSVTVAERQWRQGGRWLLFYREPRSSQVFEGAGLQSMRVSDSSGQVERWAGNEMELGLSPLLGLDPVLWLHLTQPQRHWETVDAPEGTLRRLVRGRRFHYWFSFDAATKELLAIRQTQGGYETAGNEVRLDRYREGEWHFTTALGRLARTIRYP